MEKETCICNDNTCDYCEEQESIQILKEAKDMAMEKETLEESKKSFGEIWSSLTTEQSEYLKGYINRRMEDAKKWQAERMYSEENVFQFFEKYREDFSIHRNIQVLDSQFKEWFEQFKKK